MKIRNYIDEHIRTNNPYDNTDQNSLGLFGGGSSIEEEEKVNFSGRKAQKRYTADLTQQFGYNANL